MSKSEAMGHFSELCRMVSILQFFSYKSNGFELPSGVSQVFGAPSILQELSHCSPHFILTTIAFSRQGPETEVKWPAPGRREGRTLSLCVTGPSSVDVSHDASKSSRKGQMGVKIPYFEKSTDVVVIWWGEGPRDSLEWMIRAHSWEWKSQVPHNLRSEK